MKKILVIGSKGMAGHMIFTYLKALEKYDVKDISRNNEYFASSFTLDVSDLGSLDSVISDVHPDVVINCIGILNKSAEDHPARAALLNSFLPHHLANKGTQLGFKLIHISTDCVFSGDRGNYKETDVRDGRGVYAETKALGEVNEKTHLTIRTSIIGPELKNNGIGLLDWFLTQQGDVRGYTNAIWTGITTLQLAKVIEQAIDQNREGLCHAVNGEKISKYELLKLFENVYHTNANVIPYDGYKVDKSLVDTKKFNIPSYEVMIRELKKWMDEHPEWDYKYLHG